MFKSVMSRKVWQITNNQITQTERAPQEECSVSFLSNSLMNVSYRIKKGIFSTLYPNNRNEHRWTIGKETQDNSCAHVYSPGYRYEVTDSLYGAADIGGRYGLVPGPIRVLSARQARAAAVVFTPRSSGQPIGWRCLTFHFLIPFLVQ